MIVHCILLLSLAAYSSALSHATQAGKAPYAGSIYAARLAGAGHTIGNDSYPFQFPEILSILDTGNTFMCQGSIIAANMTITAASCLWDQASNSMKTKDQFTVSGGSLHMTPGAGRSTIGTPTSFPITDIFIHPGFAFYPLSKIFEKDLALLIPKDPLVLNVTDNGPYMIALPLDKKGNNSTKDNTLRGITASWGNIEKNGAPVASESDFLNFVNYTFAKHSECVKAYAGYVANNLAAPYAVQPHSVCMNTTTERKGLCTGDTGAALRIVDPNTLVPYIVGIASKTFSNKCPSQFPDLYTRIAYFVNWIYSKGGPKPM